MKKKNVSKRKAAVIGLAALAMLGAGAGGTLAYLTDAENNVNTFTSGQVKIDLVETAYDAAAKAGENKNMVPNGECAMDPLVQNSGINEAISFLKITVPVKNVTMVDDGGATSAPANHELVFFKDAADKITDHANNFDKDWVQLADKEEGTDHAGDTRTYVFGYKKAIAKDEATTALFDKVQVMNVLEDELVPEAVQDIKIEAYAIQKDNILNTEGAIEITDNMTAETLGEIYDIFINQGTAGKGAQADDDIQTNIDAQDANTNGAKDLAGQDL